MTPLSRSTYMNRAPPKRAALALSLLLLIAAVCFALSQSPPVVARANPVKSVTEFEAITHGHYQACQGNEALPSGTTAIRISLSAAVGPRIKAWVSRGAQMLTSGERGAGWSGGDVTIPVKPVTQGANGVSLCFSFDAEDETVALAGLRVTTSNSSQSSGVIRVEYLRPGHRSWWSLISSVTSHMTAGHAWSGGWLIPFLATSMGTIVLAVCWLALKNAS